MATRCEECAYFVYDDEYEEYLCEINLDEDEVARFYSDSHYNCPYYRNGDEYKVVRHQMQLAVAKQLPTIENLLEIFENKGGKTYVFTENV